MVQNLSAQRILFNELTAWIQDEKRDNFDVFCRRVALTLGFSPVSVYNYFKKLYPSLDIVDGRLVLFGDTGVNGDVEGGGAKDQGNNKK